MTYSKVNLNKLFPYIHDESAAWEFINPWREEIIKNNPYELRKRQVERDENIEARIRIPVHERSAGWSQILSMFQLWVGRERSTVIKSNMQMQ